MIFNLNKDITYTPATTGQTRTVRAGRMECTMQNLADALTDCSPQRLRPEQAADLRTFVVFNERRYVTSSAKRALVPGSDKVHQTPEGSFLDLMRNARDLLDMCGIAAPPLGTNREYVDAGCVPAFVWLWHPSIGPLWEVAAQKIRGGSISRLSEVKLEIAELLWRDVSVDGSLRVLSENVVGHTDERSGQIVFSDRCGHARLERVRVQNKGVDYDADGNCFWKQSVGLQETCSVVLHGCSEFDAMDVTFCGNVELEVPHGHRMLVRFPSLTRYCECVVLPRAE
jgi:UTP---glucose-1-phosphate uridylyltransferase